MSELPPTLENYRREIDTIDDELIALILKRLGIVAKVKELKQSQGQKGLFIRSGREGSMVARIVDVFAKTPFCAAAASTMWRQIIGASTCIESPLTVSAYYTKSTQHLLWLAREHFGTAVPITLAGKSGQVISDVHDGRTNIGILPFPDESDAWWSLLNQEGMPRIFAHLPGVLTENLPKHIPTGLAVGHLTPEPSGDDESYFCIVLDNTLSMSKLQGILNDTGLNAVSIQTLVQPQLRSLFVRFYGFHDSQSPAILKAQEALPDARFVWLGAHARPLSMVSAGARDRVAI